MDTTEINILMCEKAVEIQERWKPQVGDYCIDMGDLWILQPDNPKRVCTVTPEYVTMSGKNDTWLPRQDQLQDMMRDYEGCAHCLTEKSKTYWLINFFYNSTLDHVSGGKDYGHFTDKSMCSMEQLWLAFVMKEKYSKTWDGKDWVKI